MPSSYSIAEARAQLPLLVKRAQAGSAIELTRRGRPVAVLISVEDAARLRGERTTFRQAYRDFLSRHDLAAHGLDAGFANGLRDRAPGRKMQW